MHKHKLPKQKQKTLILAIKKVKLCILLQNSIKMQKQESGHLLSAYKFLNKNRQKENGKTIYVEACSCMFAFMQH